MTIQDPKTASEIASHVEEPSQAELKAPRRSALMALGWARENLFSSAPNTLLTVLAVALLVWAVPPLLDWVLLKATFLGADPQACRDAGGACWSFIEVKHRFILFGLYPHDEHWRPLLAMGLFLSAIAISCDPRFWNLRILAVWGAALPLCGLLMWGGLFGLSFVGNDKWGGLPLTLILATLGIVLAFPLSVLLALGRRSDMPAIRAICVGYIETVRGVPLVSVLFMASIMFPLFLPEGMTIDKLLRAQLGIMLFTAAYLAEAVRGGLQALPKGQYEAADALGLSYWQKMGLIILPQALRLVIPPIVNQFISCFKDTSLVIIIGLYDLLTTAKTALSDPLWRPFYIESYVFAAFIYFLFCFFMSRYSQYLEKRLNAGLKR
ncbi:MAG: amino acid ABC transporter permease [Alphaproteobacteria bacterium]|nr:amino acid ABC transporter permease [Alphaproteobacteria bacterium]